MVQNPEAVKGEIDKFDCIKLYKNRRQHHKQSKKDRDRLEKTQLISKRVIWLASLIKKELLKSKEMTSWKKDLKRIIHTHVKKCKWLLNSLIVRETQIKNRLRLAKFPVFENIFY